MLLLIGAQSCRTLLDLFSSHSSSKSRKLEARSGFQLVACLIGPVLVVLGLGLVAGDRILSDERLDSPTGCSHHFFANIQEPERILFSARYLHK